MSIPTYIGYCCREWPLAFGHRGTTCGYCGEKPTYLRPDDGNPDLPDQGATRSLEDSGPCESGNLP